MKSVDEYPGILGISGSLHRHDVPPENWANERLTEFPTLAVIAPNEPLGIGSVGGAHLFCIPQDLLAGTKRDVAKVVGLSQQTGIFKVAQCRSPAFACGDPVLVVAGRARDERVRAFEIGELLFRKQNVSLVIG